MRLSDDAPIEIRPARCPDVALEIFPRWPASQSGSSRSIWRSRQAETTVARCAVANAQKAGGIAAFIDADTRQMPPRLGVVDSLLVNNPQTGDGRSDGHADPLRFDRHHHHRLGRCLVPRAEIGERDDDNHVGLQAADEQALRKIYRRPQLRGRPSSSYHEDQGDVQFTETTTVAKALKFYASIPSRRPTDPQDAFDAVSNRTRVKVVRAKVSPPFKQADSTILQPGRRSPVRKP